VKTQLAARFGGRDTPAAIAFVDPGAIEEVDFTPPHLEAGFSHSLSLERPSGLSQTLVPWPLA
jgi:hypothetical protein